MSFLLVLFHNTNLSPHIILYTVETIETLEDREDKPGSTLTLSEMEAISDLARGSSVSGDRYTIFVAVLPVCSFFLSFLYLP